MKKKALFVFIPILLALFFAAFLFNMHTSDLVNADTLKKAFKSSGAKIASSECYVWSRLDEGYCIKHGIDRTAEAIAKGLGIQKDSRYSKTKDDSNNIRKITITGFLPDGRKALVGVQLDSKSALELNYSSTVSLSEDGSGSLLRASGKAALDALKTLADKTSVNFSITGDIGEKLDDKAVKELFDKIFNAAEARRVYEIKDRNMISVSAYSPHLVNHIDLEGKQTNLNLAVRYNSYRKKTCLWLATPVITTEY